LGSAADKDFDSKEFERLLHIMTGADGGVGNVNAGNKSSAMVSPKTEGGKEVMNGMEDDIQDADAGVMDEMD